MLLLVRAADLVRPRARLNAGFKRLRRMVMVQRQLDAYKLERDTRRRAYLSAPSLREKFPRVEQVALELTFSDPTGIGKHSPQTHTLGPAARAYFEVACPCSACLAGGFDLSAIIADMLSRGRRKVSGKLSCHGWQDRGRVCEHRCLLELRYSATASYEPSVDAPIRARLERPNRLSARR
jgi:hypothetical protein